MSTLTVNDPVTAAQGKRVYGVVVGVVTNIDDPSGLGRVRLRFPWLSDDNETDWVRVATPMAGNGRGLFAPPEVNDEVLVMFDHGRMEIPYVIGALWNGVDKPPDSNRDHANNRRVFRSRSGHTIVLDDKPADAKITIADKTGKNKIVIDSVNNAMTIACEQKLTIEAKGGISLSSSGGDVTIECGSFTVRGRQGFSLSGAEGKLEATASLAVTCPPPGGVSINEGALEVK